ERRGEERAAVREGDLEQVGLWRVCDAADQPTRGREVWKHLRRTAVELLQERGRKGERVQELAGARRERRLAVAQEGRRARQPARVVDGYALLLRQFVDRDVRREARSRAHAAGVETQDVTEPIDDRDRHAAHPVGIGGGDERLIDRVGGGFED